MENNNKNFGEIEINFLLEALAPMGICCADFYIDNMKDTDSLIMVGVKALLNYRVSTDSLTYIESTDFEDACKTFTDLVDVDNLLNYHILIALDRMKRRELYFNYKTIVLDYFKEHIYNFVKIYCDETDKDTNVLDCSVECINELIKRILTEDEEEVLHELFITRLYRDFERYCNRYGSPKK